MKRTLIFFRNKKLFLLLFICGMLQFSAACYAQTVTLKGNNMPLQKVFNSIKKQTGYEVSGFGSVFESAKPVTVDVKDMPLKQFLEVILKDAPLKADLDGKTIILSRKTRSGSPGDKAADEKAVLMDFSGEVLDKETNLPIPGITVQLKDTKTVTATDKKGRFIIKIENDEVLASYVIVSSVGYFRVELPLAALLTMPNGGKKDFGKATVTQKGGVFFRIALQPSVSSLGEVQINTGMYTRKKDSFTGAVSSFTGKELRQINSLNVIQALKTLDPSFIVTADNLQGSNPNRLPVIEMRGKTSLSNTAVRDQFTTDPNQPLFVLDGMETTLQQIVDLDINRIASVTLLKDAASTVMYGSRAANGVVVVETIRPAAGDLYISYNSDLRVEMPDLSDYNMMNAAENLEFQRLSGMYDKPISSIGNDQLYNQRLASVKKGINTDWMVVPLRTGVTLGHSLNLGGGTEEFQYGVSFNYRGLNGVMLGSDHKTMGSGVSLNYRKKKLKVTNNLSIGTGNSNESPYGVFENYVKLNPYYNKYRADGSINTDKYLEVFGLNQGYNSDNALSTTEIKVENPLYNASLNSISNSKSFSFSDNLNILYDIAPNFRVSAGLNLGRGTAKNIGFVPASNIQYDGVEASKKGSYTEGSSESNSLQANAMLTYSKVINGLHSLTVNLLSNLTSNKNIASGYTATGFPEDVNGNPAFSRGYVEDSKPTYTEVVNRRVGFVGGINYSYDSRYSADLNYTLDGSTAFGSLKQFSPFWSTGLAWNLSQERFLKEVTWVKQLRIRGNIGITGNQNLGNFVSSSIYNYARDINLFGQAVALNQLGNPMLDWQKTQQISLGLDASFFNNRISANLNFYEKLSKPLVVAATLPSSSGTPNYPQNVGNLKGRGAELTLRVLPINNPDKNIIWMLGISGSLNKSKYEGFSSILSTLNQAAQESNSFQRYMDGSSPEEVWAVISLGIDPTSGQEVFLSKDGQQKFTYDSQDVVSVGLSSPITQGVLTSNLTFKGFNLGINCRYSLGAYIFNSALYNKVENIKFEDLKYNQDKRALELRWKNPGDLAQFRGISLTDNTPISSRFLEKENFLSGESINLGYQFYAGGHPWLRKLGLNSLALSTTMNEIFRWSTVRSERGIDYPFSRTVSFNLNASF